jgi:hypothetical protein
MSKEKSEHDASHEHDQHKQHDADGDHDASHGESAHQRKAPEAGVRTDTRWGDGEALADVHGRVLGISIVHGETELLIGAGRKQGVHETMTGYMMAGDTYYAQLDIVSVGKNSCRARVDATPDQIRANPDGVVINPSATPARASHAVQDYKTRVIKVDVVDGKTRITLGGGSAQGVQQGMSGVLFDESGKRIIGFKLEEIHSRSAVAFVETIVSEVYRSHSATINPT